MGDELFDPDLPQRLISAYEILTPLYQYFRGLEAE